MRRYHERPAVELYDLRADPHELHDLAADPAHADRVRRMRAQLEQWMDVQGDRRTVFNKPRPLTDPASTRPAVEPDPEAAGRRPAKAAER